MAEDQNEEKKTQDDENDPYKFFKIAGPGNDDNKDKKNKKNGQKKIPFWVVSFIWFYLP